MTNWLCLGWGFLLGTLFSDLLWRLLRRETERLLATQRSYIALLENLIEIEPEHSA